MSNFTTGSYYWCKYRESWGIFQYDGEDYWNGIASDELWRTSDFSEIDERQIERYVSTNNE